MKHLKYLGVFLAGLILASTMFLGQPHKVSADISVSMNTMAVYLVVGSDVPQQLKNKADYICDGTNDNVEMQAAINAFPIGKQWVGGVKFVGTFTVSATLTVPSNTYLDFTQAKIIRNSTSYITMLKNQNWTTPGSDTNIIIDGGIWDGDRATYTIGGYNWYDAGLINLRYATNSQVKNAIGINSKDYAFVWFSSNNSIMSNVHLSSSNGLAFVNSDSCRLENSLSDNNNYGVFIGNGATNTIISDSKFVSNVGNVFFENNVNKVTLQRNLFTLSGNYSSSGQQIYWATTANDVSFIGNTFYGDGITGGNPYLLNIDTATSSQILVQGNLFAWSGSGNTPFGMTTMTGTRVDSNIFRNLSSAVIWSGDVSFTNNNFIIDNSATSSGIIYSSPSSQGLVSGNVFTGGNTSSTNYIRLHYANSNIQITNNRFTGTSSGTNKVMAIYSGNANTGNITIEGNEFSNCYYALYLAASGLPTWNISNNILSNTSLWNSALSTTANVVSHNTGFVTENRGSAVGTGSQQTVAHGLGFTPSKQQIGIFSDNSTAAWQSADPDSTNIYVTATASSSWHWATIGN